MINIKQNLVTLTKLIIIKRGPIFCNTKKLINNSLLIQFKQGKIHNTKGNNINFSLKERNKKKLLSIRLLIKNNDDPIN